MIKAISLKSAISVAILIFVLSLAQSCDDNFHPRIMGGPDGETMFTVADFSSTQTLVVGGTSSEPRFTSQSNTVFKPILAIYENNDIEKSSAYVFNYQGHTSVTDIKFCQSNSLIVFILNTDQVTSVEYDIQTVAVLDASIGLRLKSTLSFKSEKADSLRPNSSAWISPTSFVVSFNNQGETNIRLVFFSLEIGLTIQKSTRIEGNVSGIRLQAGSFNTQTSSSYIQFFHGLTHDMNDYTALTYISSEAEGLGQIEGNFLIEKLTKLTNQRYFISGNLSQQINEKIVVVNSEIIYVFNMNTLKGQNYKILVNGEYEFNGLTTKYNPDNFFGTIYLSGYSASLKKSILFAVNYDNIRNSITSSSHETREYSNTFTNLVLWDQSKSHAYLIGHTDSLEYNSNQSIQFRSNFGLVFSSGQSLQCVDLLSAQAGLSTILMFDKYMSSMLYELQNVGDSYPLLPSDQATLQRLENNIVGQYREPWLECDFQLLSMPFQRVETISENNQLDLDLILNPQCKYHSLLIETKSYRNESDNKIFAETTQLKILSTSSPGNASIVINMNDNTQVGSWKIEVTVSLMNGQQFMFVNDLTLIANCRIVNPDEDSYSINYWLRDPASTLTIKKFTSMSAEICGSITYAIDSGQEMIQLLETEEQLTLKVKGDIIGTYVFILKAKQQSNIKEVTINVKIDDQCFYAQIQDLDLAKEVLEQDSLWLQQIDRSPSIQFQGYQGQTFTLLLDQLQVHYNQTLINCGKQTFTLVNEVAEAKIKDNVLTVKDQGRKIINILTTFMNPSYPPIKFTITVELKPVVPTLILTLKDQFLKLGSFTYYNLPRLSSFFKITTKISNPKFEQAVRFDSIQNAFLIVPQESELAGQETLVQVHLNDGQTMQNATYSFTIAIANITALDNPSNQTQIANVSNSTEANATEATILYQITNQFIPKPRKTLIVESPKFPVPKITSLSQNGIVIIKFNQNLKTERRRLNQLNNFDDPATEAFYKSAISLDIFKTGANFSSQVDFEWKVFNQTLNEIQIKIDFKEALEVSNDPFEERDQLLIEFLRPVFSSAETGVAIEPGFSITRTFPPQLANTNLEQSLGPGANSVASSMHTLVVSNFALSTVTGAPLQMLWGMINSLQLIVHLPVFSLNFPANGSQLLTKLIEVSSFSLLPMDHINNLVFNFTETDALNPTFDDIGYNTMNFLENLGSLFIFMLILPFQYLIKYIFHVSRDIKCCKKIKPYTKQQRDDTFLNAFQRLLLESFMDILICAFIALQNNLIVTLSDKVSKNFVYICLPLTFVLVCSGVYFVSCGSYKVVKTSKLLARNRKYEENKFPQDVTDVVRRQESLRDLKKLENDQKTEFNKVAPKFALFMDQLKLDSPAALSFNLTMLARRLVFVALAFCGKNYAVIQIIMFLIMSLMQVSYLLHSKPFKVNHYNHLEVANEIGILLISIQTFGFNGFVEDAKMRYMIGWAFILFVLAIIAMNVSVILISMWVQIKRQVLRQCHKCKLKQNEQNSQPKKVEAPRQSLKELLKSQKQIKQFEPHTEEDQIRKIKTLGESNESNQTLQTQRSEQIQASFQSNLNENPVIKESTFKKSRFSNQAQNVQSPALNSGEDLEINQNKYLDQQGGDEENKVSVAVRNLLRYRGVADVCEEVNIDDSPKSSNQDSVSYWKQQLQRPAFVEHSGMVRYDLEANI